MELSTKLQFFFSGGSPAPVFDADYQAVIDYATAQSYTLPSPSQQTAQNQLVLDLKAAGLWAKLSSFAVWETDADMDFAMIDWKKLITMDAVSSPVLSVNSGIMMDGVSSYVDTKFTPSSDTIFLQNDAAWGFRINTKNHPSGIFKRNGARNNANDSETGIIVTNNNGGADGRLKINSDFISNANNNRVGDNFLHFYRKPDNDFGTIRDGVDTGAINNDPSSKTSYSIYIGAVNDGGTAAQFNNNQYGFFFAGSNMYNEKLAFYNAIQTYRSAL